MAEFAQPNPYLSGTSGVGAFIIEPGKYKNPVDAFLTTYDTVNRWRANKEAEKAAKANLLRAQLADLKLDATGIRPESAETFRAMAARMTKSLAQAYQRNNGELPPEEYSQAMMERNTAQVLIEGDVSTNTIMKSAMDAAEKNADKIDIKAFTDKYRKAYNTTNPIEAAHLVGDLQPTWKEKSLYDLWNAKLKDATASEESYQDKSKPGIWKQKVYPVTDKDSVISIFRDDEEMQKQAEDDLMPRLESAGTPKLPDGSDNPSYQDDKNYIDALTKFQQQNGINTLLEAYNVRMAQSIKPPSDLFQGWSPWETASARVWASGQEDKKMYENNVLQLLKMQSQDADYSVDEQGNRVYSMVSNPDIGYYPDPQTGKAIKNLMLEFRGDIDPTTNQRTYLVASTETKDKAVRDVWKSKGFITDGKGNWFKGNVLATAEESQEVDQAASSNPNYYKKMTAFEVAQTMAKSYNEKERGKFLNYYQEMSQELGVWDNAQKSATADGITAKGLFKGWGEPTGRKELLDWQAKNITMLAQYGVDLLARKYPLMPEQRQSIKSWKDANHNRQPTANELGQILGIEKAEQSKHVASDGSDSDSWETSKTYEVGDFIYFYDNINGVWDKR